jgi:geranylgeranyl diphosphate synthase type I
VTRPQTSVVRPLPNRRGRTGNDVPPSQPGGLPVQTRPEVAEHLALVDALLTESVADLTQLWAALPDDGQDELDILGASDLPLFIDTLLATGGKRFRPVMCYLGWLSAGGRTREVGHRDVVKVGAALELLHLFALVHDDVMDESDSRRGRPTVHIQARDLHRTRGGIGSADRFGESIAILVGDLAHAEAGHLVADLPRPMRLQWRVLVAELVAGQRRDLVGTAAGRRDLAFAKTVARMKSGRYTIERPLELGAAAACGNAAVSAALALYGKAMGEAFALRDDLLGVWGDPVRTGKPSGDDLISGKPTVILSLAHDRLRGRAPRLALGRVGTAEFDEGDLALLQHQLQVDGISAEVEEMIGESVEHALSALEDASLDPAGVAELTRMAQQIAWRDQ